MSLRVVGRPPLGLLASGSPLLLVLLFLLSAVEVLLRSPLLLLLRSPLPLPPLLRPGLPPLLPVNCVSSLWGPPTREPLPLPLLWDPHAPELSCALCPAAAAAAAAAAGGEVCPSSSKGSVDCPCEEDAAEDASVDPSSHKSKEAPEEDEAPAADEEVCGFSLGFRAASRRPVCS